MKALFIYFAIFFSALAFSQSARHTKFADIKFQKDEDVAESSQFADLAEEGTNSASEVFNLFINQNLDLAKVSGEGRITTLLALDFGKSGILENISATGENESLNNEAIAIFSPYKGKPLPTKFADFDLQVLLPITIDK